MDRPRRHWRSTLYVLRTMYLKITRKGHFWLERAIIIINWVSVLPPQYLSLIFLIYWLTQRAWICLRWFSDYPSYKRSFLSLQIRGLLTKLFKLKSWSQHIMFWFPCIMTNLVEARTFWQNINASFKLLPEHILLKCSIVQWSIVRTCSSFLHLPIWKQHYCY